MSNVKVGQATCPVTWTDGGEGTQNKEEESEGGSGMGEVLTKEGGLYLDFCARTRNPSYATADGAGLPT